MHYGDPVARSSSAKAQRPRFAVWNAILLDGDADLEFDFEREHARHPAEDIRNRRGRLQDKLRFRLGRRRSGAVDLVGLEMDEVGEVGRRWKR